MHSLTTPDCIGGTAVILGPERQPDGDDEGGEHGPLSNEPLRIVRSLNLLERESP